MFKNIRISINKEKGLRGSFDHWLKSMKCTKDYIVSVFKLRLLINTGGFMYLLKKLSLS